MKLGEGRFKCPYCGDVFDGVYYFNQHVPCPSPKGDKSENVGPSSNDKGDIGSTEQQGRPDS